MTSHGATTDERRDRGEDDEPWAAAARSDESFAVPTPVPRCRGGSTLPQKSPHARRLSARTSAAPMSAGLSAISMPAS